SRITDDFQELSGLLLDRDMPGLQLSQVELYDFVEDFSRIHLLRRRSLTHEAECLLSDRIQSSDFVFSALQVFVPSNGVLTSQVNQIGQRFQRVLDFMGNRCS